MASVEAPLQTLFVSFWAAVDGRALSGLDRLSASKEFLSSLLESLEYMCRHVLDPQTARLLVSESPTQRPTVIKAFMAQQIGRIWDELCSKSLKVDDSAAASLLATTLHRLYRFDPGAF